MKLDTALKIFKEKEAKRLREGYRGDAATYAFYRYTLMFLQEIAEGKKKERKKRKSTAWNLFVGKYLRSGQTIQDAARDWKKKQTK